uniref:NADH dehydrogenase subunit 2 n=1 Tax=Phytomastax pentaspinula TaxID=3034359 RepID=UPI00241180E8|nr:NADH dehydrogenase subunit 2 [Phytomastax pentaspinula]WEL32808.1 NADH dehydrogenase subunit 2 [Phytomastax pentaspinula]
MHNNSSKMLFLSFIIMGSMISLSSYSWMGVWMGLEINMLAFMPLLSKQHNKLMNETSIKYFIIQALASSMLMMSIILIQMKMTMYWVMNDMMTLMISLSLMLKIGVAPIHYWLPEVMGETNWMNCLMLMTWQKLAPMTVMSYYIKTNVIIMLMVIMSAIIGSLGGLNQSSLRKIMAYSSINHMGWMISTMMISETLWELYFMIYSTLSILTIMMMNQNKLIWLNQMFNSNNNNNLNKYLIYMSMLSLGGLPPFLGFVPKWMAIQMMIENKMTFIVIILVMSSMITLYYYLRITLTSIILTMEMNKWNVKTPQSIKMNSMMSMMTTMSNMMIMMSPMMLFYF